MTIDPKPCPFCGSTSVQACYSGSRLHRVECASCLASGPHVDTMNKFIGDKASADSVAHERWNSRVEGDAQRIKDLEAEVVRLKAHTWEQERAAAVAFLHSVQYHFTAVDIESGAHWTEGCDK